MSDDDLPPPPQKRNVMLDDSDDDLPPPPSAASPAKPPMTFDDSDDDDGLPPPPVRAAPPVGPVSDDDSDGLPTPPGRHVDPNDDDDDDDDLPPPPSASKPSAAPPAAAPPVAADTPPPTEAAPPTKPIQRRARQSTVAKGVKISAIEKKGYLMKQKPTWPHTSQKRWCSLQGRLLNYYESETSMNPSGSLDLKGATLVPPRDAKLPHSFAITGETGQLKGRVFTFAAPSKEDLQSWVDVIEAVSVEPSAKELHWFEKMAQGIY